MKSLLATVCVAFFFHGSVAAVIIKDVIVESMSPHLDPPRGIIAVLAVSKGMVMNDDEYRRKVERSINEIRKNFPVDFVGSWFYDEYEGRTVVFSVSRLAYYTIHGADIGVEIETQGILFRDMSTRLIVSDKLNALQVGIPLSERSGVVGSVRSYSDRNAWGINDALWANDLTGWVKPLWWTKLFATAEMYQRGNDTMTRSFALKTGVEISFTQKRQFNRTGWYVHTGYESVLSHEIHGSDFSYTTFSGGIYLPWERFNIDSSFLISQGTTVTDRFPVLYPFTQRYFKGETLTLDGSYVFFETAVKYYVSDKGSISFFGNVLSDRTVSATEYGISIRGNYFITIGVDYAFSSGLFHFGFIGYSF